MKKTLLLSVLFLALAAGLHAQAPQAVTLQSVLRDAAGRLVANQNIAVRLTLTQGSATGTVVYCETHAAVTNPYGLYSVLLGQGTPSQGVFSSIDWGNGPYFLTTEADPAGGTAYSLAVVQPLVSVPYALYADTAARVAQATTAADATHATNADHSTLSDNATNALYSDTARYYRERQVLTLGHDTIYLTGGSFVVLPPCGSTSISNNYIDSVIRANNSTVMNRYVDSVIRANNSTVVNNYVDSIIRANNSTVVNNYVDSVIRANNSTVVNNYVDSIIRANNSTVVNNYVDSVIRNNNSTMVSHYVDSVINARNNTMSRDTITATIRDSVMAILRDSACYASCGSIDSLRRRNDSAYRAFDSIVNVQNITLHRYDSVINIQRRDIRRYDSIIRTFDSVVVRLVDSIARSSSSLPSGPDSCNGRNTTGIDTQVATDSYTWIDLNTYTSSTTMPRYVLRGVNAVGCDSIVTLHLTINPSGVVVTEGALPGEFSVSATKKVKFSQGNLQYQASTQTWRFAEHQYDYIGSAAGNTIQNSRRATQSDWIDLFGWATSGYHYSPDYYNFYYQPYDISNSSVDETYNKYGYGPSTNQTTKSLVDDKRNYDWGVRNAISNGGNVAGAWRTLTSDEWEYLLLTRTTTGVIRGTSNARFTKAKVCGVKGLILFPDTFTYPDGIPIPTNTNSTRYDYTDVFDSTQWRRLEALGCVFLPAAGYRTGTAVNNAGSNGYYWSSTYNNSSYAYYLNFTYSSMNPRSFNGRFYGSSVRLVQGL